MNGTSEAVVKAVTQQVQTVVDELTAVAKAQAEQLQDRISGLHAQLDQLEAHLRPPAPSKYIFKGIDCVTPVLRSAAEVEE